jgi:hypothetical protein
MHIKNIQITIIQIIQIYNSNNHLSCLFLNLFIEFTIEFIFAFLI